MSLDNETIIKRIDEILVDYDRWYESNYTFAGISTGLGFAALMSPFPRIEGGQDIEIYTRLCDTLTRYAPKDSVYSDIIKPLRENAIYQAPPENGNPPITKVNHGNIIKIASGLKTLRSAYQESMVNIDDLVNAKVFSDYIEMAEYFLNEDYVDTAAIIIGCALEQHIKQLCIKYQIDIILDDGKETRIKTSVLNDTLGKKKKYDGATHDAISGWLKIRNDAAHGNWGIYSKETVEQMLAGTRLFIKQNP